MVTRALRHAQSAQSRVSAAPPAVGATPPRCEPGAQHHVIRHVASKLCTKSRKRGGKAAAILREEYSPAIRRRSATVHLIGFDLGNAGVWSDWRPPVANVGDFSHYWV